MNSSVKRPLACDERDDYGAVFRKAGMKATRQRIAIYRELTASDAHPDAETVFSRVRRKIPGISFDTVYRTLHSFEEAGLVFRIGPTLERARFDACLEPHHHFVCEHCGRIADFHDDSVSCLPSKGIVGKLGRVNTVSYILRGVCVGCMKAREEDA